MRTAVLTVLWMLLLKAAMETRGWIASGVLMGLSASVFMACLWSFKEKYWRNG